MLELREAGLWSAFSDEAGDIDDILRGELAGELCIACRRPFDGEIDV